MPWFSYCFLYLLFITERLVCPELPACPERLVCPELPDCPESPDFLNPPFSESQGWHNAWWAAIVLSVSPRRE